MLTEREERIVAWLRREAAFAENEVGKDWVEFVGDTLAEVAGAIERGEHLKRPDWTIPAATWLKEPSVGHD